MSADNYIYVRKREDGKFGISHRFASSYYADDGYTAEDMRQAGGDETWLCPAPEDRYGVFDTAEEAIMAAHKAVREEAIVEYGVQLADGVIA